MSTSAMPAPYQQNSLTSDESQYCTTEDILNMKSKNYAKEGVQILNEKYDSLGKFGPKGSQDSEAKERLVISGPSEVSPKRQTPAVTVCNYTEGISEQDILQVDMFYRSHKTDVYVCKCLANLYFGKLMGDRDQWKFAMTGIPLIVLDTGEHHRQRKLFIVLAEKGTGFTLWKDHFDQLSSYKAPHPNFHTLTLSTDHTRLAGFSFDDSTSATEFYQTIEKLISNPDDELLTLSKSKKNKKKKEKSKSKYKAPKKTEISTPCCFVHVTKLERPALDLQADQSLISDSLNLPSPQGTSTGSEQDASEVSSLLGSKLTIDSETSSIISEERNSHS
ncbi:hypothetical protein FSP39_011123 [Pinctada imbricata]|uniref:WH1 domain-containing protein n=1 Tax=Pinctada imbricata TaxID=66713 RepID=A0AA88YDY6_PINIB|nr:hypothetical protein FSP39_011123 [Pinctada imbricata]